MATKHMPNFIRGVAAAGLAALRDVPAQLAAWQLTPGATVDVTLDTAEALAAELLAKLTYPEHVFGLLPPDAQDRVAASVGVVARAAWTHAVPVAPNTPDYKLPSWEKDVYTVLFRREDAPVAALRDAVPGASFASAWPELRSLAAWKKVPDPKSVTSELARALGKGWRALAPTGSFALPRVRHTKLGVTVVAVPGGTLQMGLSPLEQRELVRRVKGQGEEAVGHAKDVAHAARPMHAVRVDPFLCAETPVVAAQQAKLHCRGDAINAHGIVLCDADVAAAVARATHLRLLAEAEWEWIARAPGKAAWVSGTEAPDEWAARVIATPVAKLTHPFGILALGWGEWVDDGWHPTYKSAPARATAWTPRTRPEVVRGGALALWPWQAGGELVLCHAAARERSTGVHAVRLARDLPARR